MVKGRGACKLPDGAARFVQSGLRTFAAHVAQHRRPTVRGPRARPRSCPTPHPEGQWR